MFFFVLLNIFDQDFQYMFCPVMIEDQVSYVLSVPSTYILKILIFYYLSKRKKK